MLAARRLKTDELAEEGFLGGGLGKTSKIVSDQKKKKSPPQDRKAPRIFSGLMEARVRDKTPREMKRTAEGTRFAVERALVVFQSGPFF